MCFSAASVVRGQSSVRWWSSCLFLMVFWLSLMCFQNLDCSCHWHVSFVVTWRLPLFVSFELVPLLLDEGPVVGPLCTVLNFLHLPACTLVLCHGQCDSNTCWQSYCVPVWKKKTNSSGRKAGMLSDRSFLNFEVSYFIDQDVLDLSPDPSAKMGMVCKTTSITGAVVELFDCGTWCACSCKSMPSWFTCLNHRKRQSLYMHEMEAVWNYANNRYGSRWYVPEIHMVHLSVRWACNLRITASKFVERDHLPTFQSEGRHPSAAGCWNIKHRAAVEKSEVLLRNLLAIPSMPTLDDNLSELMIFIMLTALNDIGCIDE